MAFIELHDVHISVSPRHSALGHNILINPEHISKISPYNFSFPDDLSSINPNTIGDSMTEIVLITTECLGKKSDRIIVIESYDYIKTLLKQCS